MTFRQNHPGLFAVLCILGGFALVMLVTFVCMRYDLGMPLVILWGTFGLLLYYLPVLVMLRQLCRSLWISRKGTPIPAVCTAHHTAGRSTHFLVSWEDADGTHTEDLGNATLFPKRTPCPVTLYSWRGQYSLGKESAVSAGISALGFGLVQSLILIPIIELIRS